MKLLVPLSETMFQPIEIDQDTVVKNLLKMEAERFFLSIFYDLIEEIREIVKKDESCDIVTHGNGIIEKIYLDFQSHLKSLYGEPKTAADFFRIRDDEVIVGKEKMDSIVIPIAQRHVETAFSLVKENICLMM